MAALPFSPNAAKEPERAQEGDQFKEAHSLTSGMPAPASGPDLLAPFPECDKADRLDAMDGLFRNSACAKEARHLCKTREGTGKQPGPAIRVPWKNPAPPGEPEDEETVIVGNRGYDVRAAVAKHISHLRDRNAQLQAVADAAKALVAEWDSGRTYETNQIGCKLEEAVRALERGGVKP
jgi:hypothetical protein